MNNASTGWNPGEALKDQYVTLEIVAVATSIGKTADAPIQPLSAFAKQGPAALPSDCPDVLRDLPGWLIWRFEPHTNPGGKPRKVPYYVNGGRRQGVQGRAEDRQQLTTFDAARAAAARRGFDGVGFAPLAEFGVVALDFDNCVTAGRIHPEVLAVVASTYAEFSPSGKGVRAFFKGQLGNLKAHGEPFGFETFSSKGFTTFTGNVLDACTLVGNDNEVAPVDDAVRALCQRRFKREIEVAARVDAESTPLGLTQAQIDQVLDVLPGDLDYDTWIGVGMALHHETQGQGFDTWDQWSRRSSKYTSREYGVERWNSFGKGQGPTVTARTLVKLANEHGAHIVLNGPATAEEFDAVAESSEQTLPAFERVASGRIKPTRCNIDLALTRSNLCGFELRFDSFRGKPMLAPAGTSQWRDLQDVDYTRLAKGLESGRNGFSHIPRELIREMVLDVSDRNRFDSALHWLCGLKWDGMRRVASFFSTYLGAQPTPYSQAVAIYLWTAAAGRVIEPGTKADMVPVIVGPQGAGKSSVVAAIAPCFDHFLELDLGKADADQAREMRAKLVIELGELKGLRAREQEALKAFITRRVDEWVPKYLEMPVQYPRRSVFIGTTNTREFLTDDTGHRRWLPVEVPARSPSEVAAAVAAIERERDQLWAEGAALFAAGGVAWKDAEQLAKAEHVKFEVVDPWTDHIRDWLARDEMDCNDGPSRGARGVTTVEVLVGAVRVPLDRVTDVMKKRAADILRKLGFKETRKQIDGKRNVRFERGVA